MVLTQVAHRRMVDQLGQLEGRAGVGLGASRSKHCGIPVRTSDALQANLADCLTTEDKCDADLRQHIGAQPRQERSIGLY